MLRRYEGAMDAISSPKEDLVLPDLQASSQTCKHLAEILETAFDIASKLYYKTPLGDHNAEQSMGSTCLCLVASTIWMLPLAAALLFAAGSCFWSPPA